MSAYNFLQFDVFTDRAFCGNPLAVFPEAEGISDEVMGQIAREMNLSETVFVLKHDSEDVLRRLRIFTRQQAGIPVASVPTVHASHGAHPLAHAPEESAVEWIRQGLLRQLQTG